MYSIFFLLPDTIISGSDWKIEREPTLLTIDDLKPDVSYEQFKNKVFASSSPKPKPIVTRKKILTPIKTMLSTSTTSDNNSSGLASIEENAANNEVDSPLHMVSSDFNKDKTGHESGSSSAKGKQVKRTITVIDLDCEEQEDIQTATKRKLLDIECESDQTVKKMRKMNKTSAVSHVQASFKNADNNSVDDADGEMEITLKKPVKRTYKKRVVTVDGKNSTTNQNSGKRTYKKRVVSSNGESDATPPKSAKRTEKKKVTTDDGNSDTTLKKSGKRTVKKSETDKKESAKKPRKRKYDHYSIFAG